MSARATSKTYICHRCGRANSDYEAFESGWPDKIRYWCRDHIPLRSRVRLWWQERRNR